MTTATLADVRALIDESGIEHRRKVLGASLGHLADKQLRLRQAQEAERDAKKALEEALLAAEWELDGHFVTEGNKTYIVASTCKCGDPRQHDLIGGPPSTCPGRTRKPMTADERAKWKANEARKDPAVIAATKALRAAEHDVAGYRDEVGRAEKHLSIARDELNAAIAVLNALCLALPAREA